MTFFTKAEFDTKNKYNGVSAPCFHPCIIPPDFQVDLPVAPHLVVGFRREERSWVQVPIQVIKGRSNKDLSHGICPLRRQRGQIL